MNYILQSNRKKKLLDYYKGLLDLFDINNYVLYIDFLFQLENYCNDYLLMD